MTKISSKWTAYNKKLFPLFWFGFMGIFLITSLMSGAGDADLVFLIAPVAMMVFGYFLMKKLVWDLVECVHHDQPAANHAATR